MENRKVKLTKKILKETLLDELKTKSLAHITVKSLCEKADLNRSTFYVHYTDIYALFDEIQEDFLSHVPFYSTDMTQAQKTTCITEYINYVHCHKDLFYALVDSGLFLSKFKATSLIHHAHNSIHGMDEIIYRKNILTAYTVSGSVAMLYEWLKSEQHLSVNQMAELLLALSDQADALSKMSM